jgi:hypothetical protein
MKHARADYNRIQDPAGLIHEDEPVFLLRGQDMLAWMAVRVYSWLCRLRGMNHIAELSFKHSEAMRAWRPKKWPDVLGS